MISSISILIILSIYNSCKYYVNGISCECNTDSCTANHQHFCVAARYCFREYLQPSTDQPYEFLAKGCVEENNPLNCDINSLQIGLPRGLGPRLYTECCDSRDLCNHGTRPDPHRLRDYLAKLKINEQSYAKLSQQQQQRQINPSLKSPDKQSINSLSSSSRYSSSPSSSALSLFHIKHPLTIIIIISSISAFILLVFLILALLKLISHFPMSKSPSHYSPDILPIKSDSLSSSSSLLVNSVVKFNPTTLPSNVSGSYTNIYNISQYNSQSVIDTNTISTNNSSHSYKLAMSSSSSASSSTDSSILSNQSNTLLSSSLYTYPNNNSPNTTKYPTSLNWFFSAILPKKHSSSSHQSDKHVEQI